MKILIVSRRGPTNADRKGGAQEYILKLSEQLVARGYSMTILCGAEKLNNEQLPAVENISGVSIVRIPSSKARDLLNKTIEVYKSYDVLVENIMAFALNIPKYISPDFSFYVIRHHLQKGNFFKLQGKIKGLAGLFLESIVEPFIYRNVPFLAASELTRAELLQRWIRPTSVKVINPGFSFFYNEDVAKATKPTVFLWAI